MRAGTECRRVRSQHGSLVLAVPKVIRAALGLTGQDYVSFELGEVAGGCVLRKVRFGQDEGSGDENGGVGRDPRRGV